MKGKIYRLVCNNTGLQYIGSTTNSLTKRLYFHKHSSNECSSKLIILEGNYDIILIEEIDIDNRDQLRQRERYWIENMECVNLIIPYRTEEELKQWRIDNKEHLQKLRKKYYEEHKEEDAEKVECECGAVVNHRHINEHKLTDIHRNKMNIKEPLTEEQINYKEKEKKRLADLKQKNKENPEWVEEQRKKGRENYHKNKDKYKDYIEKKKQDPEWVEKKREYKRLKAKEYRDKKL